MTAATCLDTATLSTAETYDIYCPSCRTTVYTQPMNCMLFIVPKFKCPFCNHQQRLVAHSPKEDETVYHPTSQGPFVWVSRLS